MIELQAQEQWDEQNERYRQAKEACYNLLLIGFGIMPEVDYLKEIAAIPESEYRNMLLNKWPDS